MKNRTMTPAALAPATLLLALMLVLAVLASACGSDDDVTEAVTGDGDASSQTDDDADDDADDGAMNESIERLWIGPELVDCVGSGPQQCMQIRRSEDGQVEYFYDQIDGFTHEVGTTYVVDVAVTEVENPPADASSLRYRLVEIVETSNVSVSEAIDATSWTLLGFRDGDMFDPVDEEVEITLNFDGANVNGSAGCNSYMGTFSADGSELTFGPLAATKKLCPPEIMAFEDRFLPLVAMTESAELAFDGTLVLSNPTGPNLVFGPAA